MELLAGGELLDELLKGAYNEARAADTARQMLTAVAYLHNHQPSIVHRDLKPENFLYDKKISGSAGGDERVSSRGFGHLKLIDFGYSRFWDCQTQLAMSYACGTPIYCAPELFELKPAYTE